MGTPLRQLYAKQLLPFEEHILKSHGGFGALLGDGVWRRPSEGSGPVLTGGAVDLEDALEAAASLRQLQASTPTPEEPPVKRRRLEGSSDDAQVRIAVLLEPFYMV